MELPLKPVLGVSLLFRATGSSRATAVVVAVEMHSACTLCRPRRSSGDRCTCQ